jgi:t-SNARE complex subunit (syntaxin)
MNAEWFKKAQAVAKKTDDKEAANYITGLLAEVNNRDQEIQKLQREKKEFADLVAMPPVEPTYPDQRERVQRLEEGVRTVLRNPRALPPMLVGQLRQLLAP